MVLSNYDTQSNKRIKSDVSERIVITKTMTCMHSVLLQPSDGASVDGSVCSRRDFFMKSLIT